MTTIFRVPAGLMMTLALVLGLSPVQSQTGPKDVSKQVGLGTLTGAAEGITRSTSFRPSPSSSESNINDYTFQDEQLNLDANTGNVRVLRTDQKGGLNDFVVETFPIKNVTPREIRNVLRSIMAMEGGRAEVIRDKVKGEQFVEVIGPAFMMPYLREAIPLLDEVWVTEYNTGSADAYYKAKNRRAEDVDAIAENYASDSGFTEIDTTNNAASRIDEPYRIAKWLEAAQIVDIPANQVTLEVTFYEISSTDDLKLGLDYINWKNGPGRSLAQFIYSGADGNSRADTFSSVFDPFFNPASVVGSIPGGNIPTDFDQYFRSVNYLLPSSFIDFLANKGEARVVHEQTLTVKSANSATIRADDEIVALVATGREDSVTSVDGVRVDDAGNAIDVDVLDFTRRLNNSRAGQTGVFMEVTPFVGLESMELVVGITVNDLNGLTPAGLPIINSRQISTTVRLFDGQPYVIAGLKRQTKVDENAAAPLLGRIPGLGYLFGGDTSVDRWNEVLVVVTPHFQLASQPDQLAVQQIAASGIAAKVRGDREVVLPSGPIAYDQWLLDN